MHRIRVSGGRLLAVWVVSLVAAAMMAGCSGSSDLQAGGTDLAEVAEATDLDLADLDAIWFTAPWCRRCEQQLADVRAVVDEDCDRSVAIVLGRTGEGAARQFVGDERPACADPMPVVIDRTGAAFGAVPVIEAPTWVFLTGSGSSVHRGELDAAELARRLDR